MKQLIAAMALVAMGLGLSTPVYANGYVDIMPEDIDYIEHTNTYMNLRLVQGLDNTCGGRSIRVDKTAPNYDQLANLVTVAQLAEKDMSIYVYCEGTSSRFRAVIIE